MTDQISSENTTLKLKQEQLVQLQAALADNPELLTMVNNAPAGTPAVTSQIPSGASTAAVVQPSVTTSGNLGAYAVSAGPSVLSSPVEEDSTTDESAAALLASATTEIPTQLPVGVVGMNAAGLTNDQLQQINNVANQFLQGLGGQGGLLSHG